jgi:CubicO group peptidase (beta-lactamase class C family)
MQRQMAEGHLSGGVMAMARRGRLIHFASHGMLDIEAGTPMTDDRMFQMRSSIKPVTAVALLQQMEAGRVSLDDRVSRFIPQFREMRVRVGGETNSSRDLLMRAVNDSIWSAGNSILRAGK